MLSGFMRFLKNGLSSKKDETALHVQTFTYYIPGPPQRKSGYQEKQFDKVMGSILAEGFKILSWEGHAHQGTGQNGLWVIFVLGHTDRELVARLPEDREFENSAKSVALSPAEAMEFESPEDLKGDTDPWGESPN